MAQVAGRIRLRTTAARRSPEGPDLDVAARARISSLLRALAAHHQPTAEHSRQATRLSRAVGRRLGFQAHEVAQLATAALVHDVGKLLVPAQTLHRRGPLGARDRELIERHPEVGARLLGGLDELAGVARIVLEHHERPDGNGYPHGLSKSEICPGAAAVAACDAFEAMTSERPYRAAMSAAEAIGELEHGKGTQFDPAAVEALIEVVDEAGHPSGLRSGPRLLPAVPA